MNKSLILFAFATTLIATSICAQLAEQQAQARSDAHQWLQQAKASIQQKNLKATASALSNALGFASAVYPETQKYIGSADSQLKKAEKAQGASKAAEIKKIDNFIDLALKEIIVEKPASNVIIAD